MLCYVKKIFGKLSKINKKKLTKQKAINNSEPYKNIVVKSLIFASNSTDLTTTSKMKDKNTAKTT